MGERGREHVLRLFRLRSIWRLVSVDSRYQLGRSILLHRHNFPDYRGQTACHVSGCALGMLRYYVPRGRRRRSGRGSVLNINPRFRNEIKPRVDGASQAYVSLELGFRLVLAPQRKGMRFPGNLTFCATYRLTAAERSTNYEAPDCHEGGLDLGAHPSNSLCHHDRRSVPYRVSRLGSKGPRAPRPDPSWPTRAILARLVVLLAGVVCALARQREDGPYAVPLRQALQASFDEYQWQSATGNLCCPQRGN
jgi:hypothetical protein